MLSEFIDRALESLKFDQFMMEIEGNDAILWVTSDVYYLSNEIRLFIGCKM